jgi:uncharacterized membrane protein (DUF2068 family)
MTDRAFRQLLLASLAMSLLGAGVDLLFPSLVPEEFQRAQQIHDSALSSARLTIVTAAGITAFLVYVVVIYGLYRFRRWSPTLAVVCTAMAIPIWPVGGATAQSGIATSLSWLSEYLWGAVLALIYVSPLRARFRSDG